MVGVIKLWISQCKSIHSLRSIKAKANKRINLLLSEKEIRPLINIPIEKKREIISELFVDETIKPSQSEVVAKPL